MIASYRKRCWIAGGLWIAAVVGSVLCSIFGFRKLAAPLTYVTLLAPGYLAYAIAKGRGHSRTRSILHGVLGTGFFVLLGLLLAACLPDRDTVGSQSIGVKNGGASRFPAVVRTITTLFLLGCFGVSVGSWLNIGSGWLFLLNLFYLGALFVIIHGANQWSRDLHRARALMIGACCLTIAAAIGFIAILASLEKARLWQVGLGWFLLLASLPIATLIGLYVLRPRDEGIEPKV